jgi:hypothetical protein
MIPSTNRKNMLVGWNIRERRTPTSRHKGKKLT